MHTLVYIDMHSLIYIDMDTVQGLYDYVSKLVKFEFVTTDHPELLPYLRFGINRSVSVVHDYNSGEL